MYRLGCVRAENTDLGDHGVPRMRDTGYLALVTTEYTAENGAPRINKNVGWERTKYTGWVRTEHLGWVRTGT